MPALYRNRAHIKIKDPLISEALDDILNISSQQIQQTGVNVVGDESQAPPTISGLSVKGADGGFDVQITDNNPISRAIEYHVEYSTTADFRQPSGFSLGPWRTHRGWVGNQTLYWRAYSQYSPVSPPSPPVYFGAPDAVIHGGTLSGPTMQASTGSGTASSDGTQGGSGAGKLRLRGIPVTS